MRAVDRVEGNFFDVVGVGWGGCGVARCRMGVDRARVIDA